MSETSERWLERSFELNSQIWHMPAGHFTFDDNFFSGIQSKGGIVPARRINCS